MSLIGSPKLFDLVKNIVEYSAHLSSTGQAIDELAKAIHDEAHRLENDAALISAGIVLARIAPFQHIRCPRPQDTPILEMINCIAAGGAILANLNDSYTKTKKLPERWVKIISIDPDKNLAMMREPLYDTVDKPLARLRETAWGVVLIARDGA